MKSFLRKQSFKPSYLIGIWINPFFIIRRGLFNGVNEMSSHIKGGKLLDVGCGSAPYKNIFDVEEYIGIDIKTSGHDHKTSRVDKFYDGKEIPFSDNFFDHIFSSEVLEHVFNIDELLDEINRVLKDGGTFCFSCPFVWDEHEQPYDFARYTSFAIEHLLKTHGFQVIKLSKSTAYFETVIQMLSAYVYQHVLPKNKYIRLFLTPLLVAPINILGLLLSLILPTNKNFYHNNIVIARKTHKNSDFNN